MKKIVVATVLGLSAVWAYSPYSTEGETLIGDQTQVNTVVNNPISTATNLKISKKSGSVAGDVITAGDVKLFNIPAAYKLSDELILVAGLPIVNVPGTTGLGDVSFGVNYLQGKDASDMQAAEARLKIATGSETDSLGTGAHSLFLSYTYSKVKGKYNYLATGSYTLNSLFSADVGFWTGTVYGDVINLSVGASRTCILSDKVITTARVTYMNAKADTFDGGTHNNAQTNMDIWLDWSSDKLIEGTPVKWGIKIPLQASSDNALLDGDKVTLFYVSAAGFFDKK